MQCLLLHVIHVLVPSMQVDQAVSRRENIASFMLCTEHNDVNMTEAGFDITSWFLQSSISSAMVPLASDDVMGMIGSPCPLLPERRRDLESMVMEALTVHGKD